MTTEKQSNDFGMTDDEIAASMEQLDQQAELMTLDALSGSEFPEADSGMQGQLMQDGVDIISPVLAELQQLNPKMMPPKQLVCQSCPHGIWQRDRLGPQCYCRIMYVISWQTKSKKILEACDGIYIVPKEEG